MCNRTAVTASWKRCSWEVRAPASGHLFYAKLNLEKVLLNLLASLRSIIILVHWICTSKGNLPFAKRNAIHLTSKWPCRDSACWTSSRDWLNTSFPDSFTHNASFPSIACFAHTVTIPVWSITKWATAEALCLCR